VLYLQNKHRDFKLCLVFLYGPRGVALEADRTQEKNNLSTFVRVKERNDAIFLQIYASVSVYLEHLREFASFVS
jgi:hypothetical protein